MAGQKRIRRGLILTLLLPLAVPLCAQAKLGYLEQIQVEVFGSLREVERYQLNAAGRFYEQGEFKAAAQEYEKFLTLYERSAAAPYAQLMWSHCQVRLRQVNTAIKDGFQSVIDYWPESHEATLSKYLIGRSYKNMGQIKSALKAYKKVHLEHPDHIVSVYAKSDQLDIARIQEDWETRVALWKDLTYEVKRTPANRYITSGASRELARHYYHQGNYAEGRKALETSWNGQDLVRLIDEEARKGIYHLRKDAKTKPQSAKMTDQHIAFLKSEIPNDLKAEKGRAWGKDLWYRVAGTYGAAGRSEEVKKTYETMIKLFGVDDGLLGSIAQWHKDRKERDKARQVYAKFKNKVKGQEAITYMWREEKNWPKAIEGYTNLITLNGDNANQYTWDIADCYRASGKLREAINTYRQTDRYPAAYFYMARCHRDLKEWNEALVLYNQAKSHESDAASAYYEIGMTYAQAKQREKAIKSLQLTCKKFPKSSKASEAHAFLQREYKITVTLGGAQED